jgi:excisionase family DNA binding protein
MDKIYTVQQVSELLKLSTKTIKRYIHDGKLKASWFGNRWRIKQKEITRFIDEREK